MSSESGSPSPKAAGKDDGKKIPRKVQDVNGALRRAYDSAVDESIPQSMLDLLNKLGAEKYGQLNAAPANEAE